eukprot:10200557-Heterocapsa_arctica.AAC.1
MEWALVDDTPWGAAVFQIIAAYLGMIITSPFAWSKRDSLKVRAEQNAERTYIMYLPVIKKVWKQILAFSAVNLSLVARALTLNVYIITIISYIAMRLAVTQ